MGGTRVAIFEAQIMILDDPILISNIEKRIKSEKRQPEFIVNDEISKYQQLMVTSHESYMKERASDIEDIKKRIIRNLQKKRWESKIVQNAIVVSDTLTPADTVILTRSNVKAYITDIGGLTSHAAILARALDLPAIVGTHNGTEVIHTGVMLIVDGFNGLVFIDPTDKQLEFYQQKVEHLNAVNEGMMGLKDKPAVTIDGREIILKANVDVTGEIDLCVSNGAKGIGLYRTEQIIEELGEFPDEAEQTRIYTNLANRIYPNTATIRAFDIGGDKVSVLHFKEANPFLGLRGIRFLLENPGLFRIQIRAVLKASINKNIQFMLPMVSTFQEIIKSKHLIEECKAELRKEGVQFDKNISVGIMIEVPSAAIMAKTYAAEVDFFSIGTNDLIQYLMAVDRGNDVVSELYQEFHPAVLNTLNHVVKEGKKSKITISICGEMAADTLAVPILVGIGFDCLSVSPSAIPSIKRTIRALSYEKAKHLVEECFVLKSEIEITKHIEKFFKENNIKRTRNIL
jgi:phosphotransferase system enzyme I (PtsI)